MADNTLRLRVITPAGIKIDEPADMAILRLPDGDMGVLPGHGAYMVTLGYGTLRIIGNGIERRMAVYGGLADINSESVTILAPDAQWPDEIDRARAESDREQAEMRLREYTGDLEMRHDQFLLRRALVQIEISSSTVARREE